MVTTQQLSLQDKARIEMERRRRGLTMQRASSEKLVADGWRVWVGGVFPHYVTAPFASRHVSLWEWFDALEQGARPRPRIEIWGRGGAKSTSVELGCAWISEKLTRRFALYVCGTQDQADKHIQSIGTALEETGAQRAVNVHGTVKGWRRQELRAANGFNAAAYGLDVAMRGIKIDQFRPDLIIFDDIDHVHDSPDRVKKKIQAITLSVLPTGSPDCAVLFVQNLVHANSVASKLAENKADFLLDRERVTVEPAVRDMEYEHTARADGTGRYTITKGTATWEGQDLKTCEQQMNTWGLRAFLREAQHKIGDTIGALWKRAWIDKFRVTSEQVPDLIRVVTGVDPPGTSKESGAEAGIVAGGIDNRNPPHLYVLKDASLQGTPPEWAKAVVDTHKEVKGDRVVAEENYGGEMVKFTIKGVDNKIPYKSVHASRGKAVRAEPVSVATEEGLIHFVGHFTDLEDELCGWVPGVGLSPNRLDALVWIATELGVVINTGPAEATSAPREIHAKRKPSSWDRSRR